MINTKSINIEFLSKDSQKSTYDWANISIDDERVGKARCHIQDKQLTIYSINIYPEYQGKGYGKEFIIQAKKHFEIIIADRVRFNAIGFWEKMGFVKKDINQWIYSSSEQLSL